MLHIEGARVAVEEKGKCVLYVCFVFNQLLVHAAEWKLQAKLLREQETVMQAQVNISNVVPNTLIHYIYFRAKSMKGKSNPTIKVLWIAPCVLKTTNISVYTVLSSFGSIVMFFNILTMAKVTIKN